MSRGLLKKRANDQRSKEVDVWNDEQSLLQDNIREVLEKFDTIDPEIWGKIIYMEKNRRLGKAFARSSSTSGANSVIKVTDSSIGFDGLTIGLKGFNSCDRDQLIMEALSHLDKGIEIIMEDCGNIVVHNQTESRIFIRSYNLIKPEHKRFDGLGKIRLLPGRRETLFDINCYLDSIESCIHNQIKITKQQKNSKSTTVIKDDNNNLIVNCDKHLDDMGSTSRKLELQTISFISLGRETFDLLETPCYLIIINIVALDILRAKLPSKYQRKFNSINRRDRRQPRGSILNLLSHLTPSKRNITTINSPSSTSSSSPSLTLFSSLSSSSTSSASSSVSSCSSISSDYPSQLSSSMQTINLVNDCPSNVNHLLHPNHNHHRNHSNSNSNINNYQSSSSSSSIRCNNNNLTDNLHLSSTVPNHYQSSTTIKDSTWYTTNQLQSANRSHSWSILTTSTCNHNNSDQHHHQQQSKQQNRPTIIPSIKLPEPDYDDNNNNNNINQMNNQLPWYHQDNQINYNSLKKFSTHNIDQMNVTETSPMMISSRSRSYHDILTPSNNFWLQLNGDQHSS